MKAPRTVNLDKIFSVAIKSIDRAAIFAGFGINCARNEQLNEYLLPETHIQHLPSEIDESMLVDWKSNFEKFIINGCVREVMESLSVFLDAMYHCILLINQQDEVESKLETFEYWGFDKKIKELEKYEINTKHYNHLLTFHYFRNCLSHRRGIVGRKDLNDNNALIVKWLGLESYYFTEKGEKRIFTSSIRTDDIPLNNGKREICVEVVEKELAFQEGQPIEIEPKQLQEIILFFKTVIDQYKLVILEYIKKKKIPLSVVEN